MDNQTQTGLEDAILECLHLTQYTKRASLREQMTARGFYLTDRKLRHHVELLITQGLYCIQSSEKGYSLITTPEDLDSAKKYLNAKAFALIDRAKCLEENYKIGRLNSQLSLSL